MASQRAIVSRNGFNSQILNGDTLLTGAGVDAPIAQALAMGAVNANALNLSKVGALTTVLGNFQVNGTFAPAGGSTVTGNFTQSGGTFSATGNGPSQFSTTVGALTEDAAAALNLGNTTATSVNIGRAGVTTTVNGLLITANSSTRAELAAGPGPVFERTVFVPEVQATYQFVIGSVLVSNSWTVIAPTGGIAGRWIIKSPSLTLPIAGGTNDDWANFAAAAAACSMSGVILRLGAGTYLCKTAQTLPSNLTIEADPQTVISSSLLPGSYVFSAQPVDGTTTTLTTNAVLYSNQISTVAAVAVGTYIALRVGTARTQTFKVIASSGAGPFTLTLDRIIQQAWTLVATTVVRLISFPRNLKINGNGMLVSGTGSYYFLIKNGWEIWINGVRTDNSLGMVTGFQAVLFGCLDAHYTDCIFDCGGTGTGPDLMSCERSTYFRCEVRNGVGAGLCMDDCVDCVYSLSRAHDIDTPMQFSGNEATGGCVNCAAIGCHLEKGSASGGGNISITHGSIGTQIIGCTATKGANHGLGIFDDGSGLMPSATHIVSYRAANNAVNGIYIVSGVKGTVCADIDIASSGGLAIEASDEIDVSGLRLSGSGCAMRAHTGPSGQEFRLRGVTSTGTGSPFLWVETGVRARVSHANVTIGGGSYGIYVAGTATIDTTFITQTAVGSFGIAVDAGGSIRLGNSVDCDGCTNPITTSGGAGYLSRGLVTLNGTSAVDYTFPDVNTTDRVMLTRKTTSGIPNVTAPTWTITANTKVSVTGTIAGTADVYQIDIG